LATIGNYWQLLATLMAISAEAFLPRLTPTQIGEVTRLLGEIDEFKGHWRRVKEVNADRLGELRRITTIESVASSTRIEGAELSDAEVAQVLQGLSIDSFRSRDEAEVRGYGDLLEMIYQSFDAITLTENHIKQLHSVLLQHTEKDERHRGRYKTVDNHVEATDPDGRKEILFHTESPFATPRRMSELVAATNEAFVLAEVHPLFVVARFVVDFLAVHPFQDGNGRLSRGLTTLLMLQHGYEYVPYSSLERIVEENKYRYYASLGTSQLAMREHPEEFGAWLIFFLQALRTQKRQLEAKVDVERSMLQLSDAQQRILDSVASTGRATGPQLVATLKIPGRTVRYHLDSLTRQGLLEAHGQRRGRFYTRSTSGSVPSPLADPGTNGIIADVYERGKRISKAELAKLVKKHGYGAKVVGILHGRRVAHLRRDPKTGESVLTSRGEEVAREHLFSARLARKSTK
jgi:Fic family protein